MSQVPKGVKIDIVTKKRKFLMIKILGFKLIPDAGIYMSLTQSIAGKTFSKRALEGALSSFGNYTVFICAAKLFCGIFIPVQH